MKFAIKTVYIIFCAIGLFLLIVNIADLCSIYSDSEDYRRLYGFTPNETHWQFQSVINFIIWIFFQIAFYFTIFIVSWLKIIKTRLNYMINCIYWGGVVLLLFWLVRYFILWIQSGYDHYPGFDPYLL